MNNPFANLSTEAKKTLKWAAIILPLALALFFLGRHCNLGCNRTTTAITHDTVVSFRDRTDTAYKYIATYVPVIQRELKHDTLWQQVDGAPTIMSITSGESSQDTTWYSDSLYKAREFKAVINDIITDNKIAKRSVFWSDLTPIKVLEEKTTITKTKVPLVSLFLGADGVAPIAYNNLSRYDVVPNASVLIVDRYMVDVGYGIIGQQVHAGLKIKISFKKR